ncbi:hypothetical protein BKA81DRAFT_410407 [Phyllosticta paracitricarpa]
MSSKAPDPSDEQANWINKESVTDIKTESGKKIPESKTDDKLKTNKCTGIKRNIQSSSQQEEEEGGGGVTSLYITSRSHEALLEERDSFQVSLEELSDVLFEEKLEEDESFTSNFSNSLDELDHIETWIAEMRTEELELEEMLRNDQAADA